MDVLLKYLLNGRFHWHLETNQNTLPGHRLYSHVLLYYTNKHPLKTIKSVTVYSIVVTAKKRCLVFPIIIAIAVDHFYLSVDAILYQTLVWPTANYIIP